MMNFTFSAIIKKTALAAAALLLAAALAAAILWWQIGKGMEFAFLDLGPVSASNLFIQYDQGIIIRSDEITVGGSSLATHEASLDRFLPHIKKWGYLVREISLRNIVLEDQSLALIYKNGRFHVTGDNYTVEAEITHDIDTFHAEVKRFEITPYNLMLTGKASLRGADNTFLFSGQFRTPWVNGAVNLSERDRKVDAAISTEAFTDLVGVLDQFPIDRDITGWIAENISASQYKVNTLNVRFSLQEEDSFGPEDISGTAVADSASIRFHDDLEPVRCNSIDITFKNDRLAFTLDKPAYRDKALDGSSVSIDNLIEGESRLKINIKSITPYDATVVELLDKYDIYSFARQQSGVTEADLQLTFALPGFELSSNGIFSSGTGEWTIGGWPVRTTGATVLLDNNIITLKDTAIAYNDTLQTQITGEFDILSSQAHLAADIDSLKLRTSNMTVFEAEGVSTPVDLRYDNHSIQVSLREFATVLTLNKENTSAVISNLKAVSPYMPLLRNLPFSEGDLSCSSTDPAGIDFKGTIVVPNKFLSENDRAIHRFDFEGTSTPDSTDISLNRDCITATVTNTLSIDLGSNLLTIDTRELAVEDVPRLPLPVEIQGQSSLIRLKKGDLPTRDFILSTQGADIEFSADLAQGKILFRHAREGITLVGEDLDARLADDFIRAADLNEGRIDVIVNGDSEGYNGYLKIRNVLFRDYLVMNNVFAFLNAIPALATFSSTGFDRDGYRITEAIVLFDLQDELLTIRQLRADGTTVNCEARGWIDFNERTLKLQLELITLKDYSKIIDKIPLAGYALLGKDGQLGTSLDIDGSLDDPRIETHLTEEILMTPFNILQRAIQWPFKVYGDLVN